MGYVGKPRTGSSSEFPLSKHRILKTNDREVALAAATQTISPMAVEFHDSRGSFSFELCATVIGRLGLATLQQESTGGYVSKMEPNRSAYILELPLAGTSRVVTAGQEFDVAAADNAVLWSPEESIRWHDNGKRYRGVSLKIDRKVLQSRFRAITGLDHGVDISFQPNIDLSSGHGGHLWRMVLNLLASADGSASLLDNNPMLAAQYEDLLASCLLTGFEHSQTVALESRPASAGQAPTRRAEGYIREHFGEPISLEHLARESGTSTRSLHRSFREHLGTTPMRLLKDVRLDHARDRLLRGSKGPSVTEVAFSAGFAHLGAFAADYRKRHGETPSDTRRRALSAT